VAFLERISGCIGAGTKVLRLSSNGSSSGPILSQTQAAVPLQSSVPSSYFGTDNADMADDFLSPAVPQQQQFSNVNATAASAAESQYFGTSTNTAADSFQERHISQPKPPVSSMVSVSPTPPTNYFGSADQSFPNDPFEESPLQTQSSTAEPVLVSSLDSPSPSPVSSSSSLTKPEPERAVSSSSSFDL
jgi:hypothetical protein